MHIESQGGKPVCHLATLAALTGTPLKDVVRFACKSAGIRTWNPSSRSYRRRPNLLFWDAAYDAAMHFGGKVVADLLATRPDGAGIPGSLVGAGTIPSTGRGIIIIRMGSRVTHVSPWENGRVFDSNAPLEVRMSGELLPDYLHRYSFARVVDVKALPAPVNTNPEDCTEPTPDMGY